MHGRQRTRVFAPILLAVVAACLAASAFAHSALAPENLIEPDVSGGTTVGSTLTASKGAWANLPTSFIYKWQRCGTDGTGCSRDLQTGSKSIYTLTTGDVAHTVRVVVTAVNADGRGDAAPSAATDVISSKGGPKNTARPVISGDATAGQQLTVSAGNLDPRRRLHHLPMAALRHRRPQLPQRHQREEVHLRNPEHGCREQAPRTRHCEELKWPNKRLQQ